MEEPRNRAVSNPHNFVGQITFRMLCHIDSVGRLIGMSGSTIRNLEFETGAMIRISKSLRNCLERVIRITGEAYVDRKITLDFDEECDVSQAQEALVRVFEQVVEIEGGGGRLVGCRLLAHVSQIGAVMGRGGKIVWNICNKTGTRVKVLSEDQLPPCANREDEVIQIMGNALRVKRALVFVSSCLQDRPPLKISPINTSFHGDTDFVRPCRRLAVRLTGDSEGIHKTRNLEKENPPKKVVFRLLCSNGMVGAVIGSAGTIIKTFETETGASIRIAASFKGCSERVATISAFEEPEPLYSAAQIGLIRVFTRCVEVGVQTGTKPFRGKRKITTRLLVASFQVDYLIDDVGNFASDIIAKDNVEIQLLAGDLVPTCASKNDNVVQITGFFENVKSALLQLTSRIRENLFSSEVCDGIDKTRAVGVEQLSVLSPFDQDTKTEEILLSNLRKPRAPHSRWMQSLQITNGEDTVDFREYGGGSNVSLECGMLRKTTVEVVMPEQFYSSLYGENGNNLDSIREISGAEVEVQEPCPGKHDGKVTVTGTAERIRRARSLLQAFIQSENHYI